MIDTAAGEQVVRRPRQTDMIGAALRRVFSSAVPLSANMMRLLALLDRRQPGR